MNDTMTTAEVEPQTTPKPEGTIRFPRGLVGFPAAKAYRLAGGPGSGLFWLVGEDEESPSFLLSDPFVYFEGYSVELTPDQLQAIEADHASQIVVLSISVPSGTTEWTANLLGPVVINVEKGLGAQVLLSDQSAGVRSPFRPDVAA